MLLTERRDYSTFAYSLSFYVDLDTKGKDDPNVPIGIFNGATFLFRTIGSLKIFDIIKGLWRYGLSSIKMSFFINSLTKKFSNIYDLQASGKTYASVSDMLTAMGGKEMSDLTNVSADNYISSNLHWNKRLVDEFITGAMRVNYGQDISVNAFTTFVALAGMEDGSLWSVVGGNFKIAEKVLEASGAKLVMEDVIRVTKTEGENGIKYTIVTEDGNETGDFDAVIVANPLNLSSIKYENFSSDVYTAAAMTPYHRTVATFIKGSINQELFGEPANAKNFPLVVVTTNMEGPPFEFNSVGFEIPSEISQKEVKEYTKPLKDDPVRVWKVFSPQPLTDAQCQSMFSLIEDKAVVDWLAYPQYHPPEAIPSFVLDDGVFYVNAIEKAASAMEMSAIGGKNAALLAREYLLQQK